MLYAIHPPQYRRMAQNDGRQPFLEIMSVGKRRIAVHVRLRPLNEREAFNGWLPAYQVKDDAKKPNSVMSYVNRAMREVREGNQGVPRNKNFSTVLREKGSFHVSGRCFQESTSTLHVYEEALQDAVFNSSEGLHTAMFGIGLNKSGISHTFLGSPQHPGLILQVVSDMFLMIKSYSHPTDSPFHHFSIMARQPNFKDRIKAQMTYNPFYMETPRPQFVLRMCLLKCSCHGLYNLLRNQASVTLKKDKFASPFDTVHILPDQEWIIIHDIRKAVTCLSRAFNIHKWKINDGKHCPCDTLLCIFRIERLLVNFHSSLTQSHREYPYTLKQFGENINVQERSEGSIAFILQSHSNNKMKHHSLPRNSANVCLDLLSVLKMFSQVKMSDTSFTGNNHMWNKSPLLQLLYPYLFHHGNLILLICMSPSSLYAHENYSFLKLGEVLSTIEQDLKLWYTNWSSQSFYCFYIIHRLRKLCAALWWMNQNTPAQYINWRPQYEECISYLLSLIMTAQMFPWTQSQHERVITLKSILEKVGPHVESTLDLCEEMEKKIACLVNEDYKKNRFFGNANQFKHEPEARLRKLQSNSFVLKDSLNEPSESHVNILSPNEEKCPQEEKTLDHYSTNTETNALPLPGSEFYTTKSLPIPHETIQDSNNNYNRDKLYESVPHRFLKEVLKEYLWEFLNDISLDSQSCSSRTSRSWKKSKRKRKMRPRPSLYLKPRKSKVKKREKVRKPLIKKVDDDESVSQQRHRHAKLSKHWKEKHPSKILRRNNYNISTNSRSKRRDKSNGDPARRQHKKNSHSKHTRNKGKSLAETLIKQRLVKPTLEHQYGVSGFTPYCPFKYPPPPPDIKPVVVHLHRHDLYTTPSPKQVLMYKCGTRTDICTGIATASGLLDQQKESSSVPSNGKPVSTSVFYGPWRSESDNNKGDGTQVFPLNLEESFSCHEGIDPHVAETSLSSSQKKMPHSTSTHPLSRQNLTLKNRVASGTDHTLKNVLSDDTLNSLQDTSSTESSSSLKTTASENLYSTESYDTEGSSTESQRWTKKMTPYSKQNWRNSHHRFILRKTKEKMNKRFRSRSEQRHFVRKLLEQLYHHPEHEPMLVRKLFQDALPLLSEKQKKSFFNHVAHFGSVSLRNAASSSMDEQEQLIVPSYISSTSTASLTSLDTDRLLVNIDSLQRVSEKRRHSVLRGEVGTSLDRDYERKTADMKKCLADLDISEILESSTKLPSHKKTFSSSLMKSIPDNSLGKNGGISRYSGHAADTYDIPPIVHLETDTSEQSDGLLCPKKVERMTERETINEIHRDATAVQEDIMLLTQQLRRNQETIERLTSIVSSMTDTHDDERPTIPLVCIQHVDDVKILSDEQKEQSTKYLTTTAWNTPVCDTEDELQVDENTKAALIPLEEMVPLEVSKQTPAYGNGTSTNLLSKESKGHSLRLKTEKLQDKNTDSLRDDKSETGSKENVRKETHSIQHSTAPEYFGYYTEPKPIEKKEEKVVPYQFYPPPNRQEYESDAGAPLPVLHLLWGGAHAKTRNDRKQNSLTASLLDSRNKIKKISFHHPGSDSENYIWQQHLRSYLNKPWRLRVRTNFGRMLQRLDTKHQKMQSITNPESPKHD